MMMAKILAVLAAVSAPVVTGHGVMGLPKATFSPNAGDVTAFVATIQSSQFTAPTGMSFTTDPTSNTKAYTAWYKSQSYTSLKDFITQKSTAGVCGNTVLSDPQPLPDKVEWTHGASEGFTPSHEGPCEVWCDDNIAFQDENCAKNFPTAPAKLPYDKTKCSGAKKLTIYWLALHSPEWQVYINCAALSGAASGGSDSASGPSTTKSPPSTPAPALTKASTQAPTLALTTKAPSPVSTPTPTKKKSCTKKRFRRRD